MRHGVAGRKLGRNASQRDALWRGLITDLFRYERISTTDAKARSMRGTAEHLITVAKHGLAAGGNGVHARRLAARVIYDPAVTKRLFDDIAPRFAERPGGYTRIVKVGPRMGDGAEMVVLELVERGATVAEVKDADAKDAKAKGAKETKAKDSQAKGAKESKTRGAAGKAAKPKPAKETKVKDSQAKGSKDSRTKGATAKDAKPKGK